MIKSVVSTKLHPEQFPYYSNRNILIKKPVSYTHLRAHETSILISYAVFCLKKTFFNDTATTEIYTIQQSSAASDVYKRQSLLSQPNSIQNSFHTTLTETY